MTAREVISSVLLLGGVGLAVTGTLGLYQLPDTFSRMHAATKPVTLGVALCLVGAMVQANEVEVVFKLSLALVFQLLTAPVAGHLLGRAAREAGVDPGPLDDLD